MRPESARQQPGADAVDVGHGWKADVAGTRLRPMPDSEIGPWWTDACEAQVLGGVVDRAIFDRFAETHGYDSATPMNWLRGRLTALLERVRNGHGLRLHTPGGELRVHTEADYRAWVARYFPGARV